MSAAFEILFAVGLAVVALSFAGLVLERITERALLILATLLALAAIASAAALGINLAADYTENTALVLAAGGLLAAAVAEAGLLLLLRATQKLRDFEEASETGRRRLAEYLDGQARERQAEHDLVLARERANASHLLGEQERRLTQERRDLIVRQTDQARTELTEAVSRVQERLERRLAAWAADLDKGQRALETRLTELGHRQNEAATAHETRLAADAEQLGAAADEQRALLARLRDELRVGAKDVLGDGRDELEQHAAERRRALQELGQQLRAREEGFREQIEREGTEAQSRLRSEYADASRRQLENLNRTLERAAGRVSEDAERRFDAQIRRSREKSAERLSRELEKAMEQFARQAEKEIAERISIAAQGTAERLQKRTEDIARAAEAQHEVSADRLRLITTRLEEAFAGAEERIAAFESHIELEVTTKLTELQRAIRTGSS